MRYSKISLLALALCGLGTSSCVEETVSCEEFPSPVCPDAFAMDVGPTDAPRFDANRDAPGLDAFEPPRPDSGRDAFTPPDATLCSPACSGATPVCVAAGVCGECASASDCVGNPNGAVCSPEHECVQCNASTDCAGLAATPVCNVAMHLCVPCMGMETGACSTTPSTPACDTNNTCTCTPASCTTATAARCDDSTNACAPCTANADCGSVGAPNNQRCVNPGPSGVCRQCNVATEDPDCGSGPTGTSCFPPGHPMANTCSTVRRGSVGQCAVCEADSQCGSGNTCAPTGFAGVVARYCFPLRTAVCARPFFREANVTTASGATQTVCRHRTTTCEAFLRHGMESTIGADSCSGTGAPTRSDAACGIAGVDDGVCRVSGGNNRCSHECDGNEDCRVGSSTCVDDDANVATPSICSI